MDGWSSPRGAVAALAPPPAQQQTTTTQHQQQQQSSVPLRERKILFLKMSELLSDIAATEAGRGRKWLNVQPCVAQAASLNLSAACGHEDRLNSIDAVLAELRGAVGVLASDCRLKEERHRGESEDRAVETQELRECCASLLEALGRQAAESAGLREDVGELAKRVAALESALANININISSYVGDVGHATDAAMPPRRAGAVREVSFSHNHNRHHNLSPQRKRGHHSSDINSTVGGSHADPSIDNSSNTKRGTAIATSMLSASAADVEASAAAVAGLHTRVLDEVADLRELWKAFFGQAQSGGGKGTVAARGQRHHHHNTNRSHDEDREYNDDDDGDGGGEDGAYHQGDHRDHHKGTDSDGLRELRDIQRRLSTAAQSQSQPPSSSSSLLPPPLQRQLLMHTLFPPQKARWFWSGNAGSHFSRATHAVPSSAMKGLASFSSSPPTVLKHRIDINNKTSTNTDVNDIGIGIGASPPLDWDEVRLRDTRSGCWYSAGVWPCPMLASPWDNHNTNTNSMKKKKKKGTMMNSDCYVHGGTDEDEEDDDGSLLGPSYWAAARTWGCFEWTRPQTVRIARAGVYRFTAALIEDCPTATFTSGGGGGGGYSARGLGIRSRSVSPTRRSNAIAATAAATSGRSRHRLPTLAVYVNNSRIITTTSSSNTTGGGGCLLLIPAAHDSRGGFDSNNANRHPRDCCAPAQLASTTVSECCFLPEGSLLEVRCHGFHNTRATVEAFLELEFIV